LAAAHHGRQIVTMRVLITGITGFVGSHLADYLLTLDGVEIHGMKRWRSNPANIEHLQGRVILHECDLRDASSVSKVIHAVRPDRIFHLAAQSFVPTSWTAPAETFMTNIIGQLNLFEAVRQAGIAPRIHVAGSSEEYGSVDPSGPPIRETNPLQPLSPYGVSKVGQDLLGYQYFKSYRLHIIRTRAFNHTGPRRGEVFVESSLAKQLALIEQGQQDPVIRVGNLKAQRDFSDVRDMVKAYWIAAERGEAGEVYNICSGVSRSVAEVLQQLISLSTVNVTVEQDPSRLRPSDVLYHRGDCTKFIAQTGWRPQIPWEATMSDLLDYWRKRVTLYAERV